MGSDLSADLPTPGDQRGWFKSSYSTATCTCVEVNLDGDQALIRDTKAVDLDHQHYATAPVITIERDQWRAFLADVQAGETRRCTTVTFALGGDGSATLTCARSGISLGFDSAEWRAFSAGVLAGEFAA